MIGNGRFPHHAPPRSRTEWSLYFAMYLTPSIPAKSASCVQSVALLVYAVARMMLSAIASLRSLDSCAALMAISRVKSVMIPRDIMPAACRAASSPRWSRIRLNTSYRHIVGTTNLSVACTIGANCPAFASPEKYASQPEESTSTLGHK
jgi:hypothetical protein